MAVQPPAWDEEEKTLLADFYLNADGTELIGSYLAAPPIEATTRFLLVTHRYKIPNLLYDRGIPEPDITPIPERLLRLIWIDG